MNREYYSQSGQDKFLNKKIFKNKLNGFFLDIGANDGITYSNTYFFEKYLNWEGICIEPITDAFKKLSNNRSSINIKGCIADFKGEGIFYEIEGYAEMLSGLKSKYDHRHLKRIEKELKEHGGSLIETKVSCYNINEILAQHNIHRVDYCSLDIEGGELDVLKSIDFKTIDFNVVSVENNYDDKNINWIMRHNKFKKITKIDGDEIYKKRTPIFYF